MPEPDPRIAEALQWFSWASGDLVGARADLENDDLPVRLAAVRAQQAAENALKAALICADVDVAKVHNLNGLRNALPPEWSIHQSHTDLSELSDAFLTRYPDKAFEIPRTDAERLVEEAAAVCSSLIIDAARLAGLEPNAVTSQ